MGLTWEVFLEVRTFFAFYFHHELKEYRYISIKPVIFKIALGARFNNRRFNYNLKLYFRIYSLGVYSRLVFDMDFIKPKI